jgi:hypothetical protein
MFRQFRQKLCQPASFIHFENPQSACPELPDEFREDSRVAVTPTDRERERHRSQIRAALPTTQPLLTVNILRFMF